MLVLFYSTLFRAFTNFRCSYFVSNYLSVLKEIYVYFIVKYANILKYENSVNRTVITKKEDYFQIHKAIKQTSQK